jgi:co-chaperonin GroES (HSP10)
MEHEKDPKLQILDEIGDISGFEVANNQILVAVYIRPQKTKSGIILTSHTTDEDRYQAKVGLLLKKGPDAFVDPDGNWFKGLDINLNDWIVHRSSDGWSITVNGVLCRLMEDTSIKGRVDIPDRVW